MTNTLISLIPEFNTESGDWEVEESDLRGNTLEVYSFTDEQAAIQFIDSWVGSHTDPKASGQQP